MSDVHPPAGVTPGAPDEQDAWLREALRHAPDAAAAPPNALREAILAEARSAVRDRRRPAAQRSLLDHVAAFWSWLAQPPVAAGFAGLMAATLVGMMWWDRPMDESLAPPSTRAAKREATSRSSAAPMPVPTAPSPANTVAAPSPAVAPTLPAAVAPSPAATPAPPAAVAPSLLESKRIAAAKPTAEPAAEDKRRKDQAAAPVAMQSPPAVSPFPGGALNRSEAAPRNQPAAPALAKKEDTEIQAAVASPAPTATPQSSAGAAPSEQERSADAASVDAKSAGTSGEMAKAAPAPRQRAAKTVRDATDARTDRLAAAPAPAAQAFATSPPAREGQVANERRAMDDAAARPMAGLIGSLSAHPDRWARPAANGASAPLSAATQAWLASVDAATVGHWQPTADQTSRLGGALAGDADALTLSRDGRAAALVRIEESGVFFQLQPGAPWFAPLPAEVLARLRASLPPIGR